MLNNDHVQNSILHRPNSKTNRLPFLVPISDSLSMINSNSSKTLTARTGDNKSLSSRKSIRVLRPETIKRAINDACMAAAIGDLEWLKQTFKISTEKAYDKNVIKKPKCNKIFFVKHILKQGICNYSFSINSR